MPTGLTAEIYEGKSVSFRRFALKCSTQFGAGYYASDYGEKDLPLDKAPVLQPEQYYFNRAAQAEKELKQWEELKKNPEKLQKLYDEEMNRRKADNEEIPKKYDKIRNRYLTMLERVEHWDVPEDFISLKVLMIKQLKESIEYDCPVETKPIWTTFPSIDEWIKQKIEFAKENVNSANSAVLKHIERIEESNKLLKELYEALDKIEPYKK